MPGLLAQLCVAAGEEVKAGESLAADQAKSYLAPKNTRISTPDRLL